jgi:two-component system, chemotaxis family, chemotaxis protein CheY
MSGYRFDKLRILVVDDNQHMRKLVVTILQAFGTVLIFEAADGEHAWTILRDTNPDVIILDWQMSGMSGLDFIKLVRTDPNSPMPLVPIIMLTGHTHIDHVRMARDAGANEFLAKPVSVKAVLARLISVIEHPRPFVRTKTYFGPCRRRRPNDEYCGPERRGGEHVELDDAHSERA